MTEGTHSLAAIMYMDIQGINRMMKQDQAGTLKMLEFYNQFIQQQVEARDGEVVKTVGDAFLTSFPSAVKAMDCAVAVQEGMRTYRSKPGAKELYIRIGVHLGDDIDIAFHLQSIGTPGRVCLSGDVYNSVKGEFSQKIVSLGEVPIENSSRKVEAYELVLPGEEKQEDSKYHSAREQEKEGPLEFEEVKDFILGMLKSAGRRLPADRIRKGLGRFSNRFDHVLDKMTAKGFLTPVKNQEGQMEYGAGTASEMDKLSDVTDHIRDRFIEGFEYSFSHQHKRKRRRERMIRDEDRILSRKELKLIARDYEDHRERVIRRGEKAPGKIVRSIVSFAGFNTAFYFLLNYLGSSHPLGIAFPYILTAWGGGLLGDVVKHLEYVKQRRELVKKGELSEEEYVITRKLQKSREKTSLNVCSTFSISALVSLIFYLNPVDFFWPGIVVAVLSLRSLGQVVGHIINGRRLKQKLKELGQKIFPRKKKPSEGNTIPEKARAMKDSILEELKSFKKGESPLGEDIQPLLENYITQIDVLENKRVEIDALLVSIPRTDYDRELTALEEQRGKTSSPSLIREYEKNINLIQKQKKAVEDLQNQKEVMDLRLNSSLNALTQMKLDLVRMKGFDHHEESPALSLIKEKSRELSHYIDDMEGGLQDLE